MEKRPTLKPTPAPPGLGSRHGQMFLMFFGILLAYALRVNLSVGIVAMTTAHPDTPHIQVQDYTAGERGIILSSFFWGYMILQIPAGTFARKYGPCFQLSGAIAASGLITLLTPLVTLNFGWMALTASRVLVGLSQGFLYPCVNQHICKWATPQERGRLFAFVFGGSQVGSISMLMFGGIIASGPGGWPAIFYISGMLAVLWGMLCAKYGADSPRTHKYISQEERDYIESNQVNLSRDDSKMSTPWKEIWLSVPMWALLITYLGNIWGYWTLLSLMPSYISGVLGYDLQGDGLLSSLPYIAMWLASFLFSFISDYIVNNNILSLQTSRKMWNTIAQFGPATCLVLLAFAKTNVVLAIALLTLSSTLNAGMYVGYLMNPTDLSPNFTGVLIGIANGLSNITAILGPLISSYIVTDQSNEDQWRIVFLIASAIFVVGNLAFLFFGSAEIQPWNEPKQKKTDVEEGR